MREEFEKWAKDGYMLQKSSGGYRSTMTRAASEAWTARQPEIDALKAENERLRKDAERIEFLSRPDIELIVLDMDPKDDAPFIIYRVTGYTNDMEWTEVGRGKSAREAIDAAMTALPDTKGE